MDGPPRRRILVIDDSRPLCQYLKRVLEQKGYDVVLAHDGEQGVHLAMELLPDLVLLDKELPGLHGFAVSRMLRRYQATSYTPILMISADTDPGARILGLEMGADDFISKRIGTDELDSKIRAFMRIRDLQEKVLRERDKLNEIFRCLHEPIAICNSQDRVILGSQAFFDLFQMPREIVQLRSFTAILRALGVPEAESRALRQGDGVARRIAIDLGGERRTLTTLAAPIRLSEGEPAIACIFKDITQQLADERLKADFYSMIAHDLRSPLSVIQGYVGLLASGKTGALNEIQREFLGSIEEKIGEITALLRDFLDINKIDAGFVSLNAQVMPIGPAVQDVLADLSPLAADRGLRVQTDGIDPGLQVDADPLRVKQILSNLISNAIKYNVDGGWVRVSGQAEGGRVRLTVSDGGIGITPDEMENLFQPYQRGGGAARQIRGVGLGLVIVKKLVEAHGGAIEVTSRPGEGSSFSFTLRRAALPFSERAPRAEAHPAAPAGVPAH